MRGAPRAQAERESLLAARKQRAGGWRTPGTDFGIARVKPAKVDGIFSRLRRPIRNHAASWRIPIRFELLIAVLLSAQATDAGVNVATAELFRAASTPAAMLSLGVQGVSRHIKSIGLFNTKARNIIATCRILVEQLGGEVPRERAALEALPGVGRKTANVVLNVAFGEPTIAVDTHIFRVANRTGLARGETPAAVEERLLEVVPERISVNMRTTG